MVLLEVLQNLTRNDGKLAGCANNDAIFDVVYE